MTEREQQRLVKASASGDPPGYERQSGVLPAGKAPAMTEL